MRRLGPLSRNLDVLAFALALLSVGPLLGWWSVLVRRGVEASDQAKRTELLLTVMEAPERDAQLKELDELTSRRLFMVAGETVTAGVLLTVLAAALFLVARHRSHANGRMHALLQFTSHQLKTPIAGVRALMQSLRLGSIPEGERDQLLTRGIAECDRLEHLVETILAYQRAVSRPAALTDIAVDALVAEIVSHWSRSFPDMQVVQGRSVPVTVRGDADAVRVVLENLLDNAHKYGGPRIDIAQQVAGQRWSIEVADQGQGFSAETAEHLFEPFERAAVNVEHGSGLGLFISRQLARQMGGELKARSDGPGRGARFVLELPLVSGARAAGEVAHG